MTPALSAPPPLDPASAALFLDIDGTLVELAETPEAVVVPSFLPGLLAGLHHRLGGALAVVSGRGLAAIDRLLAPARLPAAGLHGLERRGTLEPVSVAPAAAEALAAVQAALERDLGGMPGVRIEAKGLAVAVHYRQASGLAAELACHVAGLLAEAGGSLDLQPGNMVLEVKPAGTDKGSAVAAFMAWPPFAGRVPVFAGDDLTDEHGFAAAQGLGGAGVIVGPRAPTRADHRLDGVPAVLAWLKAGLG